MKVFLQKKSERREWEAVKYFGGNWQNVLPEKKVATITEQIYIIFQVKTALSFRFAEVSFAVEENQYWEREPMVNYTSGPSKTLDRTLQHAHVRSNRLGIVSSAAEHIIHNKIIKCRVDMNNVEPFKLCFFKSFKSGSKFVRK